jgi:ATP synthase protein I
MILSFDCFGSIFKNSDMTNDPRLEKIKSELQSLKKEEQTQTDKQTIKDNDQEAMSTGLRAGAELITSIAAGGLIGYGLDQWLETKPIFLIIMLLLGIATGFVNVWRTTQNIGYQVGYKDMQKNDEKAKKDID